MTPPRPGSRMNQASRLLAERGLTPTAARIRVLQQLLAADSAVTHQQLQQSAERGDNPFDKVTLYRVLEWLVEQGLVHSVTGQDRVRHFSLIGSQDAHAHFECLFCGRLFCLQGLPALSDLAVPTGFVQEQFDITVRGRCADCALAPLAT